MSIPVLVKDCMEAFKSCLDLANADSRSEGRLNDEVGRFRTWTANVSAHTYGRRSLQYRLRDTSILSSAVLKYLRELYEVLQSIGQILLENDGAAITLEESSDDEYTNIYKDSTQTQYAQSPLVLDLDDVDEIVTCLLRISTTLRNPARHDQVRSSNAVTARFFESRDIEHTRMKFPQAETFLTERLGKGISRHRQYCRYREDHHQKLAAGVDTDTVESEYAESTVATSLPGYETPSRHSRQSESDAESVYTDTSFAPTLSGDSNLRPPPRPAAAVDGQLFECPICYSIISADDELSWYRHVFEDIPPYMCTKPNCKTESRQYGRRREWQHHMKLHDLFWVCPYGCSQSFGSERHLGEHLRSKHGRSLDYNALHSIANSCLRSEKSELAAFWCPLCQQRCHSAKLWFKHVGHHMEQLALFALPQHTLGNASDEDGMIDDREEDSDTKFEYDRHREYPESSHVVEPATYTTPLAESETLTYSERYPFAEDSRVSYFGSGEAEQYSEDLGSRDDPVDIDNVRTERRTNRVRIVTPPPPEEEKRKPRGILKKPKETFPDYSDGIREGVAPLKDARADTGIPPGARWTKIDRDLVNPEALEEANERFEERLDSVIVLRVLTKEEIEKLADRTKAIRDKRYWKERREWV